MKTYYSIVSIATKPQFNEKFGVGLLCVTPTDVFFHFSKSKFDIVSKLLSASARKLALANLNAIEQGVQDSGETPELLFKGGERSMMVAEPYISYLSRYNNNLVQFSAPETIDLEIDYTIFKVLFQKYIYKKEQFEIIRKIPSLSKVERFKSVIKSKAKMYVNTDFEVSNNVIKGLIAPITVDMFGKNDAFVTAHTIDFGKRSDYLQHALTSYLYLALSTEMSESKKAMCFLLGEEPSKNNEHNHDLWNNARNTGQVEFVSMRESEKIFDYFKEHDVEPLV